VWHLLHFRPFSHFSHLGVIRTKINIPYSFCQGFAIFSQVAKEFWRPSKVSEMMWVDAAFGVVRVFLGWTPCSFILEHIKRVDVTVLRFLSQVLLKWWELKQAVWDIIILNTYSWLFSIRLILILIRIDEKKTLCRWLDNRVILYKIPLIFGLWNKGSKEKNYSSAWPLTFVLKIAVDLSNVFQILALEIDEKVWRLARVVGNDEGPVESVMTKKL
jgi:hypothetical protein